MPETETDKLEREGGRAREQKKSSEGKNRDFLYKATIAKNLW